MAMLVLPPMWYSSLNPRQLLLRLRHISRNPETHLRALYSAGLRLSRWQQTLQSLEQKPS